MVLTNLKYSVPIFFLLNLECFTKIRIIKYDAVLFNKIIKISNLREPNAFYMAKLEKQLYDRNVFLIKSG